MLRRWKPLLERPLLLAQGLLTVCAGYLLGLLLAARAELDAEQAFSGTETGGEHDASHERMRIVVLVPAHDEEQGIGRTLASLACLQYPRDHVRTVVIADNCSDATAKLAREAGVETWERDAPGERGKGFALAWAIDRLRREGLAFDAVVVIDADCTASTNMLSAIEQALRSGASAAQVRCLIANPNASDGAALRFAAYTLVNTVRPLGKRHLGLSCGLSGTGFALSEKLLSRVPWSATGLAEDGEYHSRLVEAGERVAFISHAWVSSDLPTSLRSSGEQQARWEQGKLQLVRRFSPRLLLAGVSRRDPVQLHAGFEHLVPPQSLLAAASAGSAIAGIALRSRRLFALASVTLLAQLTYVLAGLRLAHAPRHVYRALALAPALVARKVALYARLLAGRGPSSWVRTGRGPL
jgi:1,2-diacylglycerol 3-beta-glucosyltransferase